MLNHTGEKIFRRRLSSLRRVRVTIILASCAFLLLASVASYQHSQFLSEASIQHSEGNSKNNYLKVITRISPNTYYESDEGPSGFEYALLDRFAKSLGKELQISTTDSLSDLFHRLERNEVHLASAGLSATKEHRRRFTYTVPYLQSQPYVVYRVGNKRPRSAADLIGKDIIVVGDSAHSAILENMRNIHPGIQWRELNNVDYIDVLGRIENSEVDYTILDSTDLLLHQGFFPRVKKSLKIGGESSFAWALPKASEGSYLHRAANQFIQQIKADGTLARLEEQYYGQAAHINQVAANEFDKNIDQQLPLYLDNIKAAANLYDMDWRLLAAISYQESAWNPLARSRTGVRGMMMLTLPTAKEVGVTNRLDPDQSLRGGAFYLNNLKSRLPKKILEPNRTWFALAAYNVGFGHLEDARVITQKRGGDPNSWYDVKQSLPLLTQKKWYSKTRYGYARGYEPVQYVQHIRHYQNVLEWHDVARNWQRNDDSSNRFDTAPFDKTRDDKSQDLAGVDADVNNISNDDNDATNAAPRL
ncbi:MAG TPA: membrane-bound lytic murein transglycosylase MltF [Cellvibrionales bacterium]|nr:membrane-bound lytic murein transglycosylase MltF [Cellvibrionales bacterium]